MCGGIELPVLDFFAVVTLSALRRLALFRNIILKKGEGGGGGVS